jgi:hypothetical protein
MALQQLRMCSDALAEGSGRVMNVRCNYGTSIVPSLFGVELYVMPEETNTLPTSHPVAGGKEGIRKLVEQGVPDVKCALGVKTLEMGERFREWFEPYPKIRKYVHIYHPDLQGPMDICEVVWGSGLFLDIMDEPDLVRQFLEIITETYIRLMREWNRVVPPRDGFMAHWGVFHKGTIMLRDDSAMNLSPEMFEGFIEPYDQRLLDEFGGGAIHFCGRGDHYIHRIPEMKGVYAVNMSQPHLNHMETILGNTVDQGIQLLDLQREVGEEALREGRDLRGNVHCW